MGAYLDAIKENQRFGDLTDVYNYISYDTSGATPTDAGKGTVAYIGPKGDDLLELEILSNTPEDERFLPGAKIYVDKDTNFGSDDLIPVKNASGVSVGYSVWLTAKREASVEEELWMLKQRVAALESA